MLDTITYALSLIFLGLLVWKPLSIMLYIVYYYTWRGDFDLVDWYMCDLGLYFMGVAKLVLPDFLFVTEDSRDNEEYHG